MPAGRIGKQVQDLRGTAAVMAEFRPKYVTVPTAWEDRTGMPTPEPEDLPCCLNTACIAGTNRRRCGAGPVQRTDETFAR